ncbi:uncharacterized protein B0P05DRAFT_590915 [Gilbertella persicaria]|uniref:uncharacterized protein n=1 Tax=Gilbertella persicaria TaxID=101096 RepID=UPI00221FA8EE|nr:uncharacterized protein B0P05DRAFT_590915 [Gilbertella persicaria]KAI8059984.1 hypothetical protein B0P05DRAFT_590915 [Gilbertella persicaria]
MTKHTKEHDKHLARDGHTEIRYGIKKNGAGKGNWGLLDDQAGYEHTQKPTDKLNLVQPETFDKIIKKSD